MALADGGPSFDSEYSGRSMFPKEDKIGCLVSIVLLGGLLLGLNYCSSRFSPESSRSISYDGKTIVVKEKNSLKRIYVDTGKEKILLKDYLQNLPEEKREREKSEIEKLVDKNQ